MPNAHPPAVFLMGPTCAGKTDLALELAERYPFDIISVDSALVYKDMNIGTAKPDAAMQQRAEHRLIDLIDPAQAYSAADFERDAKAHMAEITAKGRVPLLVGGTMMYFKFLLDGASELPKTDPAVRELVLRDAAELGWPAMHERLRAVDPASAERLAPNDAQRIARALEVYLDTGHTLTQLWQAQSFTPLAYRVCSLVVCPSDRTVLHDRIAQRFHLMLEQGFESEVRALYQRGDLDEDMASIRAVGYRQMWQYLKGDLTYEQMIERGIIATRQLAKRQLTWLRKWPDAHWLHPEDGELLARSLKILNQHAILPTKSSLF